MANSQIDSISEQIDRLSNLPDALLTTILSFLPTHIAARTSALCRRFRHLWEASPSLQLISRYLPQPQLGNFMAMATRALLSRNPSHPLLSLHLEVYRWDQSALFLASLLAKARSLNLRHLTIKICWSSDLIRIVPIIFTINSLRCLSSETFPDPIFCPSGSTLTCLRSLSLGFFWTDVAKLNPLLSQLCSLEDLHLTLKVTPGLIISSHTIRKLKLIIAFNTQAFDVVRLSLPSLESLHLETKRSLQSLRFHIHGEVPLLRKAVINLHDLYEEDISTVAGLLNWISHVEELSLHIKESPVINFTPLDYYFFAHNVEYPIHILFKTGKDVPKFSNLKRLDVTLCFHNNNLATVTMMLHNCPVLQSLKLVHEIPEFTGSVLARTRKRKSWRLKLPRKVDGNYCYAYFRSLPLGEDSKEFMKLLSESSFLN